MEKINDVIEHIISICMGFGNYGNDSDSKVIPLDKLKGILEDELTMFNLDYESYEDACNALRMRIKHYMKEKIKYKKLCGELRGIAESVIAGSPSRHEAEEAIKKADEYLKEK